jgi:uncharacterized protein (TIGR03437 family)
MSMSFRALGGVLIGTALSLLLVFPAAAQQQRNVIHYALILEDPPVGQRFTTREATHSVEAENYRAQIRTKQANLKTELESRHFVVVAAIDTLSNAIFVATTPDRVDELKSLAGVKGVIAMRPVKPRLNQATSLANAPVAWTALGGQSNAGKGIMVATIGSGIDQNHPAFQDPTLTMPAGFPKCTVNFPADCNYTNNKVIVARSYVRELSAGTSSDPNQVAVDSGPDDYSPRDRSGHNTAIASVIAGNQNTGPAVSFSGMAPKAWLGNYKVENSPGMPGGGNGNSWESIYVQALEDAFNDGMHIANLSSGVIATTGPLDTGSVCGQAAGVPCDFFAYNFEQAAKLGMVITVSAGNDGENGNQYPTVNLISSPSNAPSVISVGATMNGHVLQPTVSLVGGPSNLQNIQGQTSDAGSGFMGSTVYPVIDAAQAGNDGYACVALPAYALYNAIALIEEGNCDYTTKATNAAAAGALGIVFYSNVAGPVTPIETEDSSGNLPLTGPIGIVTNSDGLNLKTYIDAHPGSSLLLDAGGWEMLLSAYNTQAATLYAPGFEPALAANMLLGFSSPGPDAGDLTLKPDIVSTGGSDQEDGPAINATNVNLQDYNFFGASAMYMATQAYDQASDMYSADGYIAANGTSFSAPMVAGAAALLMQLHPTYTAAQIKALLMNTANSDTKSLGDNWGNTVDALNVGAGRMDMNLATKSSVIAQVVTTDGSFPVSASFGAISKLPVSKQIQVTNLGTASNTLSLAVTAPVDVVGGPATGATIAVSPASVTLAAGASATVTLTISGTVPSGDEYTGNVNITGTGVSIHVPYLFLVPNGVVYDMFAIQFGQITSAYEGGCFESLPSQDAGTIGIKLVDIAGVPVTGSPVSFSVSPRNSATLRSVSGEPACSPSSSTSSTKCNTDNYGIAWVDVVGGSSTSSSPLITASSGTLEILFGGADCGIILPAPNITSVSEAAVGGTSIAAGSYISVYGANLADTLFVGNNTFVGGDGPTYVPLPMNLDFVSGSFDIPAGQAGAYDGKPADYNGAPMFFTFVSNAGSQLNVMIPWELQGATSALVKVTVDGFVDSNVITIPLATYAPQLFNCGTAACAIDQTTYAASPGAVSATNPVHAGDIVQLYGNGFGPVNNQPVSGVPAPASGNPLSSTKAPCTVTVGGQNATVYYCGLAPGTPAEFEVVIAVPSGLATGNQPVLVTTGGVSSKSQNLPIK